MSNNRDVRRRILQAIVDCRNTNRTCTRSVIAEITGLTLTKIDDHIKRLKGDEDIRALANGVFEPVEPPTQDRDTTATITGGARVSRPVLFKLGEVELPMTLREARNAAAVLGGIGIQFRG